MSLGKLRISRLTIALVLATGACLTATSSASAGTLGLVSGTFIFSADSGVADAIQVLPKPGDPTRFLLSDTTDTITLLAGTGCTGGGTTQVDCPDVAFLELGLGDQGDIAIVNDTVGLFVTLKGGSGADSLDGGGFDDQIYGELGNDLALEGGPGFDRIEPGLGTDSGIDGGPGNDWIDYNEIDRTEGVNVNLAAGTGGDGESLSNFEGIVGTDFADTLQGTAGVDTLIGNGGADTLIGGAGADHLNGDGQGLVSDDGAPDTASYSERATPVVSSVGGTSQDSDNYNDIQNLAGGSGADTLTGDGLDNVLTGNGGVDVIFGAAGADTLNGNAGDDQLDGGNDADVLGGDDGNDLLTGGQGSDTINGGLNNDTLIGGSEADSLIGGGGTDTASYQDGRPTGIALDLGVGAMPDSDTHTAIGVVVGTEQSDNMTGGPSGDDLRGAGGGDTITGAGGIDNLQAQGGDDIVRANDGQADTIGCGAGADQVEADGIDTQIECETQLAIFPQLPATPVPAPPDTTKPIVSAKFKKSYNLARAVKAGISGEVTSNEAGKLVARATVASGTAKKLGLSPAKSFVVVRDKTSSAATGKTKLKLKLTNAAKRGMKVRRGVVKLVLLITVSDSAGNTSSISVKTKLTP